MESKVWWVCPCGCKSKFRDFEEYEKHVTECSKSKKKETPIKHYERIE
jgi:hypothetical protein